MLYKVDHTIDWKEVEQLQPQGTPFVRQNYVNTLYNQLTGHVFKLLPIETTHHHQQNKTTIKGGFILLSTEKWETIKYIMLQKSRKDCLSKIAVYELIAMIEGSSKYKRVGTWT